MLLLGQVTLVITVSCTQNSCKAVVADSVKFAGALPNHPSKVETHNTTHEPTYTDMAKDAAAAASATVSGAVAVAAVTAREVYDSVQDYAPPMSKAESNVIPQHQAQTPQSQYEQGQLAHSHSMAALPSPSPEEATTPDEKGK